jgi:hypothetical protein
VGTTANFTTTRPFIPGNCTFSIYAYTDGSTDGSAVTTADAELLYNNTVIPTIITAGSKAGWYLLQGAFTVNTEGSYPVGVRVKSGKTVYVDDAVLTIAAVGVTTSHVTKNTPITYNNTEGAAEINAIGTSDISFTQTVAVPTNGSYTILARVYDRTPGNVGGVVDSSKVQLIINGVPASTAFTAANGNFWNAQVDTTLTAGTYSLGVRVKSGSKVVVDNLAVQQGSGTDRTFRVINSGTGLAFLDVESTIFANSGRTNRNALVITSASQQTANLVEWKDFGGNVLGVIDEDGGIGIGTDNPTRGLEVIRNISTSQPVAFLNSSSDDTPQVGVLWLALGTTATGTDSRFVQFYAGATTTSNGTGVGRIRLNNGGVAYESGGADFAEYFTTDDADRYQPGDVVMLAADTGTTESTMLGGKAIKADLPYASTLLGVVSDTAAFVGNARETDATDSARIIVGLIGQMNVNVSTVSGTIKAGDLLTSSSIAGIAQKATRPGMTLGIAMEDIPVSTSAARVFVRPVWNSTDPVKDPWYASGEASLQDLALLDTPLCVKNGDSFSGTQGSAQDEGQDLTQNEECSQNKTVLDMLTVLGKVNAEELYATGKIGTGLLTLESLNSTDSTGENASSIDTLAGALLMQSHSAGNIEIMGGKAVIDKLGNLVMKEGNFDLQKGVFKGNDSFTGTVVMPQGKTKLRISKQWSEKPASVLASPDQLTGSWAVQEVSKEGFTIVVDEPVVQDVTFSWLVLFKN